MNSLCDFDFRQLRAANRRESCRVHRELAMEPVHELSKNGERSNWNFLRGADTEKLVPLRPGHFPMLGATLHVYLAVRSTLWFDFQGANDQWHIGPRAKLPRIKDTSAPQLLPIYPVSATVAKVVAFHT
jgi:hypothetical protein